jgi:hypothetical protein
MILKCYKAQTLQSLVEIPSHPPSCMLRDSTNEWLVFPLGSITTKVLSYVRYCCNLAFQVKWRHQTFVCSAVSRDLLLRMPGDLWSHRIKLQRHFRISVQPRRPMFPARSRHLADDVPRFITSTPSRTISLREHLAQRPCRIRKSYGAMSIS